MTLSFPNTEISGTVELTHLGVIRATGEEAGKFLQGQLTQDVTGMNVTQASLAAFCNSKGRMQASFVMISRSPDEILLICSRDLVSITIKRLSMFVMRAKVELSDASDIIALYGATGSSVQLIAGCLGPPWSKANVGDGTAVFLYPGAGHQRALWCVPMGSPNPGGRHIDLETWNWLEVQSGIAMVTKPIFEAFVPQMLNYESVDGVNFRKGCYPGQEVVARSQFRGALKRRAYLVHSDAALAIGQEVFHSQDADQPCGLVAAAAACPLGGFDAIISLQTAAVTDVQMNPGSHRLTVGSVNGSFLELQPMPYLLRQDI